VPEVYSHSRLSSFESCPRKFQYRYLLKLPSDTESIEAFAGKRVHEVLERLYKAVQESRIPHLKRVIERFRVLWDEHYDAAKIRFARGKPEPAPYRANAEQCLTNYYGRNYPFDKDETLGLEQRVTFSLDTEGDYKLQGVIDRVVRARDEAIEIHDFKTSQRVPRQSDLDRDRQLALYQIGVAEKYGADRPIRLVWHYLLPDQVRSSTRTPEALAELRTGTISLIDKIRAETRFEPKPGPLCAWCEYAEICPASGRMRAAPAAAAPPPAGQIPLL
jgi:putative RecB family exonuclease